MSKTAFYFKTRDEFSKVFFFVNELDIRIKKKYDKHRTAIRVYSRYATLSGEDAKPNASIPKKIPTKKKYIGIISGNKHLMIRAGINFEDILKELNVELVGRDAGTPKYTGEKSSQSTHIKNYKQFRKLVSVFNKRFGHGNWRIQGPKKLQEKLRRQEGIAQGFPINPFVDEPKKNNKGIKVTIVANEPNANIKKLLFKIALMT